MREPKQPYSWKAIDDGLPIVVEDVLESWRESLVTEVPWSRMERDDVDGLMPGVLAELLDLARDPDQSARRHRMVVASRAHGAFRRSQACPGDPIRREFAKLTIAILVALQHAGLPASLASDAISAIEPDLDLARLAAARGFDSRPAAERLSQ